MKKSNFITLLSFTILIILVLLYMIFGRTPSTNSDSNDDSSLGQNNPVETQDTNLGIEPDGNSETESNTTEPSEGAEPETGTTEPSEGAEPESNTAEPGGNSETETNTRPADSESPNSKPEPNTGSTTEPNTGNIPAGEKVVSASMDDALFIGDSRTVGIAEYAGIEDADFFATVGMSVYNIHKDPVAVSGVGKVTLTELLDKKKYDKIYIMLGVNEVGYPYNNTVSKYKELIELIEEKEPGALIFVQANLHVTQSRSESDKVVNNKAINELNARLSELADSKNLLYLDANVLFDDANGNLSSDKAGDSAHLYAKYYKEWGEWIVNQTKLLLGES